MAVNPPCPTKPDLFARSYDCFAKALGREGVIDLWLRTHGQAEKSLTDVLYKFFYVEGQAILKRLLPLILQIRPKKDWYWDQFPQSDVGVRRVIFDAWNEWMINYDTVKAIKWVTRGLPMADFHRPSDDGTYSLADQKKFQAYGEVIQNAAKTMQSPDKEAWRGCVYETEDEMMWELSHFQAKEVLSTSNSEKVAKIYSQTRMDWGHKATDQSVLIRFINPNGIQSLWDKERQEIIIPAGATYQMRGKPKKDVVGIWRVDMYSDLKVPTQEDKGPGDESNPLWMPPDYFNKPRRRLKTADAMVQHAFDRADFIRKLKAAVKEPLRGLVERGTRMELALFRPRRRRAMRAASFAKRRRPWEDGDGPVELEAMRIHLPPEIQAAVDRFTNDLLDEPYWEDMADTTRKKIVKTINRGLRDGKSGDEVAKKLEEVMGPKGSKVRAKTSARTESTGALNAGHQAARDGLAKMGLVKSKQWLAVIDDFTREDHEDANEQIVPNDEPFIVGGEEADYPGDTSLSAEERINCRCTSISVPLSEEESQQAERDLVAWAEPRFKAGPRDRHMFCSACRRLKRFSPPPYPLELPKRLDRLADALAIRWLAASRSVGQSLYADATRLVRAYVARVREEYGDQDVRAIIAAALIAIEIPYGPRILRGLPFMAAAEIYLEMPGGKFKDIDIKALASGAGIFWRKIDTAWNMVVGILRPKPRMKADPVPPKCRTEVRYRLQDISEINRTIMLQPGDLKQYDTMSVYYDKAEPTWSIGRPGPKFRLRTYDNGQSVFETKETNAQGLRCKTRGPVTAQALQDLVPICMIAYHRLAWEKDGLRITVDANIRSGQKSLDGFVVEVKNGPSPDWLVPLLPDPDPTFGKVAWATEGQAQP